MRRVLIVLVFLAGCGGAREAQAPAADYPPASPTTPTQAAPESAGAIAPDDDAPADDAEADRFTVDSGRPRSAEEALAAIEAEAERLEKALASSELSSGCGSACRALGSMRRAVDGLCEMTGHEDARCQEARRRLEDNDARVASSGCGC